MIANRVKSTRISMGLTQDELGKMIGVTGQAIYKIEEGMVKHPRKLSQLAKALNVREEWLLTGNSDYLESSGNEPTNLENLKKSVLKAINFMTEKQRNDLLSQVSEMAAHNSTVIEELQHLHNH